MEIKRVKQIDTLVLARCFCNKCGCDIGKEHQTDADDGMFYHAHVEYSGGYDSKNGIYDGDSFKFDLCEKCLVELMKTFKTPPTYSNFICGVVDVEWPANSQQPQVEKPNNAGIHLVEPLS